MSRIFNGFGGYLPVWSSNSNLQRDWHKMAEKYKGKSFHVFIFAFYAAKLIEITSYVFMNQFVSKMWLF